MDPMGIKPLNFTLAVALLSLARSTHIRIAASTGAGILLLGPGDGGGDRIRHVRCQGARGGYPPGMRLFLATGIDGMEYDICIS